MSRPRRADAPGMRFHVFNRGLARRTIFERRADCRAFLAELARSVRRGELEVLGYTLMTTHFHLFVRSRGRLAIALRTIQSGFTRRFNAARGRSGPLFEGRYEARRVNSERYAGALRVYIHRNAVSAGIVSQPRAHPWCDARWEGEGRRPPWLTAAATTSGVDAKVAVWLVESRLARRVDARDDESDLLDGASERRRAWWERTAGLADGTTSGVTAVPPDVVVAVLGSQGGGVADARWRVALCGLLADLSGCRDEEIAGRCGMSSVAVRAARRRFRTRLRLDVRAREWVEHVTTACLERAFGEGDRRTEASTCAALVPDGVRHLQRATRRR